MRPEEQMLAERDRLIEAIVVDRVNADVQGDNDVARFARSVAASALLGRSLPMEPVSEQEAAEPLRIAVSADPVVSLPALPVSPDAPVEPSVPENRVLSGGQAPGGGPSGETPGEVKRRAPSPVKQSGVKAAEETVAGAPLNEPGSSGAIYEARRYVLACVERGDGIIGRMIENLTGWTPQEAQKFIREVSDEARRKGLAHRSNAKPQAERIEAGIGALLQAVNDLDDDDDDEPDEEELAEIEPEPVILPRTKQALPVIEAAPHWWSEETARHCANPDCGKVIPPRQLPSGKWEAVSQYNIRRNCSIDCAYARQGKAGRKGRNFRPKAEPASGTA